MKKTLIVSAVALSLSILFLGLGNNVLAQEDTESYGRLRGMGRGIELHAEFFGISEEDLRAKIDSGMTMLEVAEELNINLDAMKDYMLSKAQERWESLGLSQEEIDERTQRIQERQEKCPSDHSRLGSPFGQRGMGFHKNQ